MDTEIFPRYNLKISKCSVLVKLHYFLQAFSWFWKNTKMLELKHQANYGKSTFISGKTGFIVGVIFEIESIIFSPLINL